MKTIGIVGFVLSILALIFVVREAIIMQKFRKSQGYGKDKPLPILPVGTLPNTQPVYNTIEEFWAGQVNS
jgi:hypothetical protein